MCGIVMVAGDITYPEKRAFSHMLKLDTIRGPHSTGVIAIDLDGKYAFEKRVGTAYDFVDKADITDQAGHVKGQVKCLIGHNRFATMGAVNARNSHPFDFKTVIGVHNGMIERPSLNSLPNPEGFQVDSEILYRSIDEIGLEDTIPKVTGAWSLVMYDKEYHEVTLLRNKKRPMVVAFSENGKTIFAASEEWMIVESCKKFNIKIKDPFVTEEDIIHAIDLRPRTYHGGIDMVSYDTVKVEGKKPPVFTTTPAYQTGASNTSSLPSSTCTSKATTSTTKSPSDTKAVVNVSSTGVPKHGRDSIRYWSEQVNAVLEEGYLDVYYDEDSGVETPGSLPFTCIDLDLDVRLSIPSVHSRRAALKASTGYFFAKPTGWAFDEEDNIRLHVNVENLSEERPFEHPGSAKLEEPEVLPGFAGNMIDLDKWKKLVSDGCCNCTDNNFEVEEADDLTWINQEQYICEGCMSEYQQVVAKEGTR